MRLRRSSAALYCLGRRPASCAKLAAPAHRCLRIALGWLSLVVLSSVPQARAATIHVPADQPTIQAGINAAANGDTVLVAPGTYFENIDFKGKAITVTSSGGAAVTTIDGGNKDGVATVIFSKGETSTSVISKFTIRGGGNTIFVGNGNGGVYVNGASPTIQGNTITANYCHNIDVEGGAATIRNNEVSGVLQNNQGTSNYCSFGSGIFLGATSNTGLWNSIIGNTIENNLTGSGINLWIAQNVIIMNNIIRNNTSHDPGSALTSVNSNTVLVQNLIYGNTSNCGGALGFMGSIFAANNMIVDNIYATPVYYTECTPIAQIYPGPYQYGVSSPTAVFINNIIKGATSYPAVNCSWLNPPSEAIQPTFQNNILYNSGGPFFGSYCVDVSSKYNNITADPQFVSPSTGDYHLKSTSPAIDAGQNSVQQTFLSLTGQTLSTDFDGNPRVQNATAAGCSIDMGAYEYAGALGVCGTSEILTSSLNPAVAGQTVIFTVQLTAANGTPTGTVQFLDGANVLSTQSISGTGSSSFSTSSLAVGSHTITASYQPTGTFSASSATLTQVISGFSTTTVVASSLNPAAYSQSVSLTATVTNTSSNSGPPTGTITFSDGINVLGTQPLTSNSTTTTTATFTTSTLTVGTHTVTATYNPTTGFAGSTATLTETITGLSTSTALTSSTNPANAALSITFTATITNTSSTSGTPTGAITFSDGATVLATQPLASSSSTTATAIFPTSTLAAGTHTITATYVPTGAFSASTAVLTQVINALASVTSLTAAPNPANFGQPVTLVAGAAGAIITGGVPTPTGTITFFDGATQLGSAPILAGQATITTSTLTVGTHTLTAVYSGNAIYSASTSFPFTETIKALPQDFTITLASPTITIQTQHHTTTTVTLASLNGFADSIALGCVNPPTYVTCRFTPASTPLAANGTATVSLYLDTDSVLGYAHLHSAPPITRTTPSPINLALLFSPIGLVAAFTRRRRRPTRLRLLVFLLIAIPVSAALTGCGEIIYPYAIPPSATPGTYTLQIVASGAATGLTHTTNLTLQITP